jgi:hypothetical protein
MAIRDFYNLVIEIYSYLYYMQRPLMNNQAWYQAKWHAIYAIPDKEHIRVAIRNGLPRSMQDKLDQKDEDYRMVDNETFLDYLYRLEMEDDRQERAEKQRLKESLERKGNLKAAEAVETGVSQRRIRTAKKAKKGKYCDWCTKHGKDDRFIHSYNEADCNFKKAADKEADKKKWSKSGSGRSINALKKEQQKIKKILRDDSLSSEGKQRIINKIYDGGSSRKRKSSLLHLFFLLLRFQLIHP